MAVVVLLIVAVRRPGVRYLCLNEQSAIGLVLELDASSQKRHSFADPQQAIVSLGREIGQIKVLGQAITVVCDGEQQRAR